MPFCVALLMLLVALLAIGCGPANESPGDENGEAHALRIVSLSPAISRTLIDFDLDGALVGRTPFCETVDASVPIVGDLLDLNMEMLVRVRPTHVLIQPPASGIDPALMRAAADRGWIIGSWHLDSIDDVRRLILELPEVIAEGRVDVPPNLSDRADELYQQIEELLESRPDVFRGSTLLVFGLEPVTVFGQGTYLDEVLTALGGTNVITHRGYPQFSLEDITRMQPEAVIMIASGTASDRSPRQRLGAIGRLDIPAVQENRLAVLDHPDGFLPSSGLVNVAQQMRDILLAMGQLSSDRLNREDAETPHQRDGAP